MLNLKLISKILGSLLWIEGVLMLLCLLVSLIYYGVDILPFVWSILITVGAGIVFRLLGRHADNLLGRRDAYFVVTISWILFTLFGTLPFMLSGYIGSFTDAFFEAMSGFTTTGATIIDYLDTVDWWIGNCILYHSHPSFYGGRFGKGICCRSNWPY